MPGCMIMVGDMCNPALKLIVDGLCTALATERGSAGTRARQHGMVEVTSLPLMASGYVGSPDDGPIAATHPTAAPPPELDMAAA